MAVNYTLPAINDRLQGVINAIDGGGAAGSLVLREGGTVVSTITLALPCGTVDGGVLTFGGTLIDLSAAATGEVDNGIVYDSAGIAQLTGLTVGVPPSSGYEILISNGINSTLISSGQTVQIVSAQITGS
jgi:hypothetical protein